MIRPTDRKTLAGLPDHQNRPSGWPRTSRRQQRVNEVISRRQTTLTVVLEDIHDPHNVSAVLRSCDAVGILDVHIVYAEEQPPPKAFSRASSGSSAKWIRVHRHDSIEACYATLRANGFVIHATALSEASIDLYDLTLTVPSAMVFGNEIRGLSDRAVSGADDTIFIPMQGMVESLNISVACAVTLYEAMRQRAEAGLYENPMLSEAQRTELTHEWLRK
jgi:tRNA (guanosine-2'-O-)-methyltransferase